MRGYKALPPVPDHRLVVGLLMRLALEGHVKCPGVLASLPVTHWAIVPSLPAKPHPHPLRSLVTGHARGTESPLVSAAAVRTRARSTPVQLTCTVPLSAASHVLLIDDTWTTGGHAHSAALALRNAGAARVSVLVVARWLKVRSGDNKQFIAGLSAGLSLRASVPGREVPARNLEDQMELANTRELRASRPRRALRTAS